MSDGLRATDPASEEAGPARLARWNVWQVVACKGGMKRRITVFVPAARCPLRRF